MASSFYEFREAEHDDLFVSFRLPQTSRFRWWTRRVLAICTWALLFAVLAGYEPELTPRTIRWTIVLVGTVLFFVAEFDFLQLAILPLYLPWIPLWHAMLAVSAIYRWVRGITPEVPRKIIIESDTISGTSGLRVRPRRLTVDRKIVAALWVTTLAATVLGWGERSASFAWIAVVFAWPLVLFAAGRCFRAAVGTDQNRPSWLVFVASLGLLSICQLAIISAGRPSGRTLYNACASIWFGRAFLLSPSRRVGVGTYAMLRWDTRTIATAYVLVTHIGAALRLFVASLLACAALLRLIVGTHVLDQEGALLAVIGLFGLAGDAPTSAFVPNWVGSLVALAGWLLFGLWISPLAEQFMEWRSACEESFRQRLP